MKSSDRIITSASLLLAFGTVGAAWWYLRQRFELASPQLQWVLLAIPVILVLHFWFGERMRPVVRLSTAGMFKSKPRGRWVRWRHVPFAISLAGSGLLLMSLTRPQSRNDWQDVETEGIDIMLALDVSASMLARDFDPDRLSASRNVGIEFIEGRPNDRIGLVVYEGEAFTQCPLTTDHDVLKDLFAATRSGLIQGGTAVGLGLATAVNRLRESDAKSRVVILLTDGVNNAGTIHPVDAAVIAKELGVRVYTIGVGTLGKALSPVAVYPNGQYKYDMVDVEIDEEMLKEVATITGGKYFRATNEKKLSAIYKEIDELERTLIKVTEHSRRNEEYFPFVLLGGCLMLLGGTLDRNLMRPAP
ncbi:MAG: VWA domain-containing protein [Flavobacteriales bacterium]|nr:VWA domain-containing protein [Flavobacteriales bacterium]